MHRKASAPLWRSARPGGAEDEQSPSGRIFINFRRKRFLINKIVAQARLECQPLTKDEEKILYFTVLEPTVADEVKDFTDADPVFEEKIAELVRRCYEYELGLPGAGDSQRLRSAFELLQAEDHYLVVMAEPVSKKNQRSRFTQVTLKQSVLIVIVLAVLMILGAWVMGRVTP